MADPTGAEANQNTGTDLPAEPTSENFGNLIFPHNLETLGHFMLFSPFEYSRANRMTTEAVQKAFKGTIILPVPHDLSTGYKSNYSTEALDIRGAAVLGGFAAAERVSNVLKSTMSRDDKALSLADEMINAGVSVKENIFGALANIGLGMDKFGTDGAVSIATGVQRNPHLAVLFTGVDFKSHTFSYKFFPKSIEESISLQEIIYIFKYSMAPDYVPGAANHLFKYPDEWAIVIQDNLFKIGNSVLTDFNVNYHGQGIPAYFAAGEVGSPTGAHSFPAEVHISLTFQETSIITKQDILMGR